MRKMIVVCVLSALTLGSAAVAFAAPVTLSLGTASLGGNFFTMGAAMASVFTDTLGYRVTAQATGGSAANLDGIHEGELDLGMSQAMTVTSAVKGTEQFAGTPFSDLRTLVNYSATPIHFLVRSGKGIKGMQDLMGRKVECLSPGDGIEITTKKFAAFYGMPADSVKLEYSGNRVQAASRLKTLQLDAVQDATGLRAAWMTDVIGDGSNWELISIPEEDIARMCEMYPEFSRMVIPANTYKGQTEDVVTVGFWTVLPAGEGLDDDVAYNLVKALYENKETLVQAHNFFKDLEPENIQSGCAAPVHEGAARYYREIGALK